MQSYHRVHVELREKDGRQIAEMLRKGQESARVLRRASILRQLDGGQRVAQVAENAGVVRKTVRIIAGRYEEGGLELALHERPRRVKERALSASQSQRVVAMVCGPPPEGRGRWTVRLITEEAVKRKLVPPVSRETIRILLQSHDLKPWREKMWCVAQLDEEYIRRMEDVLALYERPLSEEEPVVCIDEKPVLLHAAVRPPRPMRPGRIARRDCEYQRRGRANAFCGVEPQAGRHFTKITSHRSAAQFADYLLEIAASYPEADTIHLVMDNLSSHRRGSSPALFSAIGAKRATDAAYWIAQRGRPARGRSGRPRRS